MLARRWRCSTSAPTSRPSSRTTSSDPTKPRRVSRPFAPGCGNPGRGSAAFGSGSVSSRVGTGRSGSGPGRTRSPRLAAPPSWRLAVRKQPARWGKPERSSGRLRNTSGTQAEPSKVAMAVWARSVGPWRSAPDRSATSAPEWSNPQRESRPPGMPSNGFEGCCHPAASPKTTGRHPKTTRVPTGASFPCPAAARGGTVQNRRSLGGSRPPSLPSPDGKRARRLRTPHRSPRPILRWRPVPGAAPLRRRAGRRTRRLIRRLPDPRRARCAAPRNWRSCPRGRGSASSAFARDRARRPSGRSSWTSFASGAGRPPPIWVSFSGSITATSRDDTCARWWRPACWNSAIPTWSPIAIRRTGRGTQRASDHRRAPGTGCPGGADRAGHSIAPWPPSHARSGPCGALRGGDSRAGAGRQAQPEPFPR